MASPRDCRCLCCPEPASGVCSADFHRDVSEEWETSLDATERLHINRDGDATLYTFEDVEINCEITEASVVHEPIGYGTNPGSLAARLRVVPSDPSFTALRHWWPNDGASVDLWSHHEHLAYGTLYALYSTRHGVDRSDFGEGSFNLGRSTITEGYAYADGETQALFGRVIKFTNDASEEILLYTFAELGTNQCWSVRNLPGNIPSVITPVTPNVFYVLDPITGVFTEADDDIQLSAGLVRSLFAPRRDLTVGWVMCISSTWDTKALHQSEVEPEYYASTMVTVLCQVASFLFNCVCAFYGKPQILASCSDDPDPAYFPNTFLQNVEPVELRGFSLALDLTQYTEEPGSILSNPLWYVHTYGFAYYGIAVDAFDSMQTGLPITVEIWYVPCVMLILAFSSSADGASPGDGYPCGKTYIHFEHKHQSDFDDGFATQPSTSGFVDVPVPIFGFTFRYVGTECLDETGHDFHTSCYSLSPINIGYVRNVKDEYSSGPFIIVPCIDQPCVEPGDFTRYCGFRQMILAGLTFTQTSGSGIPSVGRFYIDISEVPE
jgi:hypothetical protein